MIRTDLRGMIEIIVVLVLFLLIAFGAIYLNTSSQNVFSVSREAFRLEARVIAQGGFEKSILLIKEAYRKGHFNWQYPVQAGCNFAPREFTKKLGNGMYRIESIKHAHIYTSKDGLIGPYKALPYIINGVKKGYYDLFEVDVRGIVKGVGVTLKGIVKVIRYEIVY